MSLFIDLHGLQSVGPSCINRDDTGSPKSTVYGGTRRARVSSQAWKRAIRSDFAQNLDASSLGVRTTAVVTAIAEQIVSREPELADRAEAMALEVLKVAGFDVKDKSAGKRKADDTDEPKAPQFGYLLFVARAQLAKLAQWAIDHQESDLTPARKKKAVQAIFHEDEAIDVALFGRMVADAPELNVDAACQVAHAISVHQASPEFDYFTAMDDLQGEDSAGATMIGTVEFVAPTLYRYATINVTQLIANLGSAQAAAQAVRAFTTAFATSMPTGKQNTFANRTRPEMLLVEIRDDQPVNLCAAFETAITETSGRADRAMSILAERAVEEDKQYGTAPVAARFLAVGPAADSVAATLEGRAEAATLAELSDFAAASVRAMTNE